MVNPSYSFIKYQCGFVHIAKELDFYINLSGIKKEIIDKIRGRFFQDFLMINDNE